jgi:DUF4097 and DUF4098 domain-containing protein YvlB
MSRHHVYVVVGAVALTLGLAQLGGCSCTPMHWQFSGVTMKDGVELPYRSTVRLSAPTAPSRFALQLDAGSIEVTGDPALHGIEAEFVVHEKVQGDASLALDGSTIVVRSSGGHPTFVDSAKIRVPAATEIDARTDFGSVTVAGIRDVAAVAARSQSGRVRLRDVHAVPRISGESSFGEVSLETGSDLGELSLTTQSGSVRVTGVTGSKTVTMSSEFGSVNADAVTASDSMSLRTSSGSVSVTGSKTPRASLKTDFGTITAKSSALDHLEAKTSSGSVRLSGCVCRTKELHTDFGSVREE